MDLAVVQVRKPYSVTTTMLRVLSAYQQHTAMSERLRKLVSVKNFTRSSVSSLLNKEV